MHFSLIYKVEHSGGVDSRVQLGLDVAQFYPQASLAQCVCQSTQSRPPPCLSHRTTDPGHRPHHGHLMCRQMYSRRFHACYQLNRINNCNELSGFLAVDALGKYLDSIAQRGPPPRCQKTEAGFGGVYIQCVARVHSFGRSPLSHTASYGVAHQAQDVRGGVGSTRRGPDGPRHGSLKEL